jgi:hypothetical protein
MSDDIRVIKVIDQYKIVINKGTETGISKNQNFLIYSVDDEPLIDPVTNENLGYLENVKGRGTVLHLQPKAATLISASFTKPSEIVKTQKDRFNFTTSITREPIEAERLPFENVEVGDLVKII